LKLSWAALVAALVAAADQLTKAWVVATLPLGEEHEVVGGLVRLVHTGNRGVAFGMLGSAGPAVQIAVLLTVVLVVVLLARQLARGGGDGPTAFGLALVLGGALGNLADRVFRGEVVDFLDFYVRLGGREHHWPAFNLADSCITVGAALVIVAELLLSKRRRHVPDAD
jgi:signal peptidase II